MSATIYTSVTFSGVEFIYHTLQNIRKTFLTYRIYRNNDYFPLSKSRMMKSFRYMTVKRIALSYMEILHCSVSCLYCTALSQVWYVKVTQLYLTLCDLIDYTVHEVLQARKLEWVAVPFFGRSFQPRYQTQVSPVAGRFFTSWATMEVQEYWIG